MLNTWRNNHDKKWDVLTKSKEVHGLKFQELHSFNKELLKNMVARVLEEITSLWVRILIGVYFPRGDFLSENKGSRSSCGWSNLLIGRDILRREGI